MQYVKRLTRRAHDRGASLVEYALLVALIAVVCIGAVTFLGGGTSGTLDEAGNGIEGGDGAASGCPAGSHRGIDGWVDGPGAYVDGPEEMVSCYDDVTGQWTADYEQ